MSNDPFDLVGQIVGGQFRVASVAGDADLSVVYRGLRLDSSSEVAIKCLTVPETIPDQLARALEAAFQQAYRVHDRLARGHANIAQTITSGETRAPRTGATVPYLVREWLEGESLAAELAGREKSVRSMRPVEEVLGLLQGACEAVAFAHTQGEVHLGINPGNLFVARQGDGKVTLKVLDFGLARMMNDFSPESPAESHSGCGLRLSLPGYLAPEQVDESVGVVGTRTDVYALALVATEALAGHSLPQYLDEVLQRALSPDPGRRQADAGALWRELSSAVAPRAPRATLTDIGAPVPLVAGALARPRLKVPSEPSSGTVPMSFEAVPAGGPTYVPVGSPRAPDATKLKTPPLPGLPEASPPPEESNMHDPVRRPPAVASDALYVEPSKSPSLVPPPLSLLSNPPPGPVAALANKVPRRTLVLGSAAAAAAIVVLVGAGVALRSHRASASVAPASAGGSPLASAASSGDAPQAPGSAAASPGAAASADSRPAPASPSPSAAPKAEAPFAVAAARRALDAKKHDVGKCRHGRVWGNASASVTFANDGSVDKVVLAPPFAGTPTGTCVSDALSSVHVSPFAGAPGSVTVRYAVSAK
jgi:serine/threonine-protein kinase